MEIWNELVYFPNELPYTMMKVLKVCCYKKNVWVNKGSNICLSKLDCGCLCRVEYVGTRLPCLFQLHGTAAALLFSCTWWHLHAVSLSGRGRHCVAWLCWGNGRVYRVNWGPVLRSARTGHGGSCLAFVHRSDWTCSPTCCSADWLGAHLQRRGT